MTKITNRDDLRTWVEEQIASLDDAQRPEAMLETAIEAATDALAARARKDGLLYGRDWQTWLGERGEAALLDHLVAAADAGAAV